MRFIGCKENLLGEIELFINERNIQGKTFCDLFAGTASVGKHFKKLGYRIVSSDILYFSFVLQKVYIEQNQYPQFQKLLKKLKLNPDQETLYSTESQNAKEVIKYLNELPGKQGFIYRNYSPEGTKRSKHTRQYFTGQNAAKIDAIRDTIEEWNEAGWLNDAEYFYLLCALVEAVPFVANISGTYAAFLKNWDKRAFKDLTLEPPEIIPSSQKHIVRHADGLNVVKEEKGIDILYLDPPYNERQYAPNYHLLETIALGDKPRIKGVTGMRDYSEKKSGFCNAKTGLESLKSLLNSGNYKHTILSYNDEGIMSEKSILDTFAQFGKTEVAESSYQRYKSHSRGKASKARKKVSEKLYHLKKINPKNTLNDLTGSEWVYFLNSVEVTNYPTGGPESYAHKLRKQHPSPKPPQLMQKLIEFFTKEDELIFDPFLGVGGTALGASLSRRRALGVDLSKEYIQLYKKVSKELGLPVQQAKVGNALNLPKILKPKEKFDFILTDPPYGDMLSRKRTGESSKNGNNNATPFTAKQADLGNMDLDTFLLALRKVISDSVEHLKDKGYVAVFVKDLQPRGKQDNMLHASVVEALLEIPSLSFRGYKIWYDKTLNLYPFGYPHAFVANQFHQFILFFRKELD